MKKDTNITVALVLLLGVASFYIIRKRKQLTKNGKKLDVSNLESETAEDTPVNIDLQKSDKENEVSNFFNASGSVSYELTANPKSGTAQINGNVLTYTPSQDFYGSDVMRYVKRDSSGQTSNEGTITISVLGVYDGTSARDINITTQEDTGVTLNLGSSASSDSTKKETTAKETERRSETPSNKIGFDGSFTKKHSGITLDFNGDY